MSRKLLLFSIIATLVLSDFQTNAQTVTIAFNNITLSETLEQLNEDHQLKFAYDNELTNDIIINESFKNADIDNILDQLLKKNGLSHKKINDIYVIIPLDEDEKTEKNTLPETPPKKITCMVKGVVKDKNSGENLPYASIAISGTPMGTMANSEGYFSLISKNCDSITLTISYLGYSLNSVRIKASENPLSTIIYMNAESQVIEAVEVKDKIEVFDNVNVSAPGMVKFNPAKLNNIPSVFELDISAPIQLMPGIDGTTETAAGYEIRKSAPDKNLILYDGFTIYQTDHFFGTFSSFNSKLIKDIQVYKGGYDAKYGGRVSGIIDITGKSGNIYHPVADIGADMLGVDAKLEVPVIKENLSFVIAGRRSYTDYFHTPLYIDLLKNTREDFEEYYSKNPSAFTTNEEYPKYYYFDIGSKITWKPKDNQTISLSFFESKDDLSFNQTDSFPKIGETAFRENKGIGFSWTGAITPRWQTELKIGASKTATYYDHTDTSVFKIERRFFTIYDSVSKLYFLDNALNDLAIVSHNNILINETNRIETGVSVNNFESYYLEKRSIYYNSRSITDTVRDYDKSSSLISPYIQHIYDNGKINIKTGFRENYYTVNKKSYPELRLQTAYRLKKNAIIKGSIGNYHQFTNKIFFTSRENIRSYWIISDNDRFPIVSSFFAMLGTNINFNSSLNIDAEIYYKKVNDLVSTITYNSLTGQGVSQKSKLVKIDQNIRGLDLLAKKSFGNYQTWIAYSLSQSLSQGDNVNNGEPYPSNNDQTHEFKLFNIYKLKNWNFTLTWIYGSGKPWDNITLTNDFKLSDNYEKNSERLPAYHRMDAGINYLLKLERATIKTSLSFYNVYNHINHIDRLASLSNNPVRDVINGKSPIEYIDIYGLGLMPNLYINVVF